MKEKSVKIDPETGRLVATRDISKEETITLNQEEFRALGDSEKPFAILPVNVQDGKPVKFQPVR